jgi:hypothetical protein
MDNVTLDGVKALFKHLFSGLRAAIAFLWEALKGMVKFVGYALNGIIKFLSVVLKGVIKFFARAFCFVYVIYWGLGRKKQKLIRESLFLTSVLGAIVSIIEEFPELEQLHIFDLLPSFLRFIPGFVSAPIVRWIFILVALRLLWLKILEWFAARRESVFTEFVFVNLQKVFNFQPTMLSAADHISTKRAQGEFVYGVLVAAKKIFTSRTLRFQIMLQDEDGRLDTKYREPPGAWFAQDYRPMPGEGAAGLAFATGETVYVPMRLFRQGIRRVPERAGNGKVGYKLAQDVFVPSREGDPFNCVLCIPIQIQGASYGVLNIVCNEINRFQDFHIEAAQVVGVLLAFAVDKQSRKIILPKVN